MHRLDIQTIEHYNGRMGFKGRDRGTEQTASSQGDTDTDYNDDFLHFMPTFRIEKKRPTEAGLANIKKV
jgi:hypothetical protein